jgi:hypothetical protein
VGYTVDARGVENGDSENWLCGQAQSPELLGSKEFPNYRE